MDDNKIKRKSAAGEKNLHSHLEEVEQDSSGSMAADQEMKSEEEIPEPPGLKRKVAENPASSKMTLQQLMELSMQRNDEHFARLDTQLGAVKKEAEVTKSLATKAVTIADQTNVKVT